jgi:DNA-directed RNA polymerase specialized sigma24 family protein
MTKVLYETGILDGLARETRKTGLNEAEAADVVAESVTALYKAVRSGKQIRDAAAFLVRVSHNRASDRFRRMPLTQPLDSAKELVTQPVVETITPEEDERRRALMLAKVRELLPSLGPTQRQVVAYIVDAVEDGDEDVPEERIAADLGLSQPAVHLAKWRGLNRLADLAREAGLVSNHYRLQPNKHIEEDAAATDAAEEGRED